MNTPFVPFTYEELVSRLKDVHNRLIARYGGLLEMGTIPKLPPCRRYEGAPWYPLSPGIFQVNVDFIHRTARDFLYEGHMQNLLAKNVGDRFNLEVRICHALLLHIKKQLSSQRY